MNRLAPFVVSLAGLLLILVACTSGGGPSAPPGSQAPSPAPTDTALPTVAPPGPGTPAADPTPSHTDATTMPAAQAPTAAAPPKAEDQVSPPSQPPSCESVFEVLGKLRELQSLSPAQLLGVDNPAAASQAQAAVTRGDLQEACRILDQVLAQASSGGSIQQPAASAQPSSDGAQSFPATQVTSRRSPVLDYEVRQPPLASLIDIGVPGPDGATEVSGRAGSVPASTDVMVATLSYSEPQFVRSSADGSFSAKVTSAPGATVQVRYNPHGALSFFGGPPDDLHQQNHWPGTLIRVRGAAVTGSGAPFSSAGFSDVDSGFAFWSADGVVGDGDVLAGKPVPVSGSVKLLGNGTGPLPASVTVQLHFGLDALFDSEGWQTSASSNFVSSLLTPTGFPIERERGASESTIGNVPATLGADGAALTGSFNVSLPVPGGLPDGVYRLYVWIPGNPGLASLGRELPQGPENNLGQRGSATIGVLTVGSPKPPRLSPVILMDSPNQASRGLVSEEERGRIGISARVAAQPGAYVVEPKVPGTGELAAYRLEPFFPFVSLADRNLPNDPLVPFKLPGGSLTVSVTTPSGKTETLGTAPILQARTGHPSTSRGQVLNNGGGNPGDVYQLTTLSGDFLYQFREYGQYTISLSGEAEDIWGREYPFSGTYKLWAAETLDVETASLPSTPFEAGDVLPAAVRVLPGVPADVEMSVAFYPIDGSAVSADSVSGRANRYGYFDGDGKGFEFSRAGEYAVNLTAKYRDEEDKLWMASRRWGSAVAGPSPALIAHGRRGEDSEQASEQLAWFSRSAIGVKPGPHHLNFPYHSGDIVWATDDDSVQMRISLQDPAGTVAGLLSERAGQSSYEGPDFQERRASGELPLGISTSSGQEATSAPRSIDQWAYAYRAVQRPGVRVRETVATDHTKSPYWRFNDQYLAQWGMGAEGDLPNDLKWQFGVAVFKRPEMGIGEVAIYGSLWVQIPDGDPLGSRVFPPFQGASGGPDGGPIITLKGKEIDLFLLPTGVRPGDVLEEGDRFVFAGQVGPPLAAEVSARVVSPSGVTRTISGKANHIGYFFNRENAFAVDEPGVWTVTVETVHRGGTSAGPVEAPYPAGSVLGSGDGTYQFYVVPREPLKVEAGLPGLSFASNPVRQAIRLYPRTPDGWTNVQGYYTVAMPGYILEEGVVTAGGGVVEIAYDPARLQRDFPNIDLKARADQRTGLADQVTVSVLLTGEDRSGGRAYAAKRFTLVGEDLYDLN